MRLLLSRRFYTEGLTMGTTKMPTPFRPMKANGKKVEQVVEACITAGLVGGEGFAVDTSLIQGDANNKQRSIAGRPGTDRDPARSSHAVKE